MSSSVSVVSPEQQSGYAWGSRFLNFINNIPARPARPATTTRQVRQVRQVQPNLGSTLSKPTPTPCAPNSNCRITLDNYYKAIPAEVKRLVLAPAVKVASPTMPRRCNDPQTDLNGDGKVDALDIQIVINSTLNLISVGNGCADFNDDGFITAYDVYSVINYTLGIRS